jgi:hypothetical protein
MLFLLLFVLAVFLAVRFDVPTQAKIGMLNLMYGDEMRSIKKFRLLIDPLSQDLEKEGLTHEGISAELALLLEKGGIRVLEEAEWQNTSSKPVLNLTVQATLEEKGRFQYSVTLEVGKSKETVRDAFPEKSKTLWLTSGAGVGGVTEICAMIENQARFFIKSHSGS